ncbi:uncharacterized protein PAE49_004795 isoform 2-T2 [Odontesthes bonariensis]|uniref:uncharacterized protein LOC142378853 isoform X2 n=1 Tax=Odontesthes bonariensis TaxID=219752 RepID=UPI003F5836A2
MRCSRWIITLNMSQYSSFSSPLLSIFFLSMHLLPLFHANMSSCGQERRSWHILIWADIVAKIRLLEEEFILKTVLIESGLTVRMLFKVIVSLMTVCASLYSVMGNKREPLNSNCETTITETAFLKGSVTINCKYPVAEETSVRLFCKKDGYLNCTNLISSYTANITKHDRISLKDDKHNRVYKVTIHFLTQKDAGNYWCAMRRTDGSLTTCLSEIHLRIFNSNDLKPEEITQAPEETAQIICKFNESHDNSEKLLCKGENPSNCMELIRTTSDSRDVVEGRFDLRENKRLNYFYVYINNLSKDDSGTYWCVIGGTEYTKIHLSVAERRTPPSPRKKGDKDSNTEDTSDKRPLPTKPPPIPPEEMVPDKEGMIAGIVVGLVLLAVALAVLILCRRKLFKTQVCCAAGGSSVRRTDVGHDTEGNNGDHNCEEIQLRQRQPDTVPSVYATVTHPTDQLHYASVNFQKYAKTTPDGTDSSGLNGSVNRSAETTLYSTFTKLEDR